MKKTLLAALITLVILTSGTVALYVWLNKMNSQEVMATDEVKKMELDEQRSDQGNFLPYNDAIGLITEGAGKNVLTFDTSDAFNVKVSAANMQRLERLKERAKSSPDDPIIAYNPFGTSENTFYFYFRTNSKLAVRYTIVSKDKVIKDFSRMVLNEDLGTVSQNHEFIVRGIIPGRENYINIGLYDQDNVLISSKLYKFNAKPAVIGKNSAVSLKLGKSKEESSNGLYFVNQEKKPGILLYDNSGSLRGVLKQKEAAGKRMVWDDNTCFYSISKNKIARLSNFGQVLGVYSIGKYKTHNDFDYDGYEFLYLVSKVKSKNELIRLSTKTGKIQNVLSLDSSVEIDGITLLGEGGAILSAKKPSGSLIISGVASSIAKVSGVLGSKNAWKHTRYQKKVLKTTGKSKDITVKGLVLYDAAASQGKRYTISFLGDEGKKSFYCDGVLDLSKRELQIKDKFAIGNSVSGSGQKYGNHVVICSGKEGKVGECDASGANIKELTLGFPVKSAVKMDLKGYWFY